MNLAAKWRSYADTYADFEDLKAVRAELSSRGELDLWHAEGGGGVRWTCGMQKGVGG